jgi:hypothetical protein
LDIINYIVQNAGSIILDVLTLSGLAIDIYIRVKNSTLAQQKAPIENTHTAFDLTADAATIIKSYTEEMKNLRVEYQRILSELKLANEKINKTDRILVEWGEGIKKLLRQLKDLEQKPCWEPSPYFEEPKKVKERW